MYIQDEKSAGLSEDLELSEYIFASSANFILVAYIYLSVTNLCTYIPRKGD